MDIDSDFTMVTPQLDAMVKADVLHIVEEMPWMKGKKFILMHQRQEIEEYIDKLIKQGIAALDIETTGLNTRLRNGEPWDKIVGICLASGRDEGVYIPIAHRKDEGHYYEHNVPLPFLLEQLKKLAANCVLIFHNFKFDGAFLRNYGVIIGGDSKDENMYEDTLIMAVIQDASRKNNQLKYLSKTLLQREMLEIKGLGVVVSDDSIPAFDEVPPEKAVYYGAADAMNTFYLYEFFKDLIDKQDPDKRQGPWGIYKIEKRCMFVTMEMERNYVKIDKEYLKSIKVDLENRSLVCVQKIWEIVGRQFDVASPKQLGTILFDELKLKYPVKEKTKTEGYQTSEAVLEKIAKDHPIIEYILDYRGYQKYLTTYIDNLLENCDENDEIKFELNQTRADTGRYSATGGKGLKMDGYSKVNCQNLPRTKKKDPKAVDIRKAFVAHDGFKIATIDYSGEELRIAANLSREPKWIKEFLQGTGDLHTITAKIIYNKNEVDKDERGVGKCVAKGTLIASERGWVPIEELKVGDKVITHTGELKKIDEVHFMGNKIAKVIETTSGHKITCGYNHRFLTIDNQWVRAEDLKIGQKIKTISCEAINPTKNIVKQFNFWNKGIDETVTEASPYIEINELWARLLGYLLGDGHIPPYYAGMVCSPDYNDVKEDVLDIAKRLGLPCGAKLIHRKDAKNPIWNIRFGSTIFSRFCKHIGFRGRRGKIFRIPQFIFESPKNVSKEFLRGLFELKGLFETDGTIDEGSVSVCTKDLELARDIVLLLSTFGVKAYIYVKPSKKYKRDYYQVQFGRLGADVFEKEVGFISKSKKERLQALTSKPHHPGYPKEQIWETEIKNLESLEEIELLDLTIAEDHTYIAQGLITHNTLNFLTLYGGGPGGFAAQAKIPIDKAKRMIYNFFKQYVGIRKWIESEVKVCRKRGYSRTPFGRRRPLGSFYNSTDEGNQKKGDRCAINSEIQGAGSDIIKIALHRASKWIREQGLQDKIRILVPIHDEIVFEIKNDNSDVEKAAFGYYIEELSRIMIIDDVITSLKWPVHLEVDAEYGDSFSIDHDYYKEKKELEKQKGTNEELKITNEDSKKSTNEEHLKSKEEVSTKNEPVSEVKNVLTEEMDILTVQHPSIQGISFQFEAKIRTKVLGEDDLRLAKEILLKRMQEEEVKDIDPAIAQHPNLKDLIDSKNYLIWTISCFDTVVAMQIAIVTSMLEKFSNMFSGPKCFIKLVDKNGEVLYTCPKKISADAFVSLCLWLNV
jgi:DNA polymerase I-like protein with 3'-5' exonuclease and polymerase domains